MWTSIVTAAAALAGALTTGLLHHLATTRTDRAARRDQQRQALHTMLAALVDHRRHQYLKIAARREGQPDTPDTRAARYAARSAVTHALDQLALTVPDTTVHQAASDAVAATFALGDTPEADLDAAGDRARRTHDHLRDTAAAYIHNR